MRIATLLLILSLGGCTRPCAVGTVLLTLKDVTSLLSAGVDTLEVKVDDGEPARIPVDPETLKGEPRLEIDLRQTYTTGRVVDIEVKGFKGSETIAVGRLREFVLERSCSTPEIMLEMLAPDPAQCTIAGGPESTIADGKQSKSLTITIRDGEGIPLPGVILRLSSTVASDEFGQVPATDESGTTVTKAWTEISGTRTVRVQRIQGGRVEDSILAETEISFGPEPPAVVNLQLGDTDPAGCIPFSYGVVQREFLPVTVRVEVDVGSGYTLLEVRAVNSAPSPGATDSLAPWPGFLASLGTVRVRVTPVLDGHDGIAAEKERSVASLLRFSNNRVGRFPTAAVTGDFNGDHKLDLVTTNNTGFSLSILLGNGSGTFEEATTIGMGTSPLAAAAGDLNGDGKLDLVTANTESDSAGTLILSGEGLTVLFGKGDGSFAAPQRLSAGMQPSSVTVADFNGDGALDLAATNTFDNNVGIHLNLGAGTFEAATNFAVGNGPRFVTTGDVDGDGLLDLVTANSGSNNVSVLLGTGDGSFGPAVHFATGSGPRAVALGDLNGGGLDIVTANYGSANASVLLNQGNGTFAASASIATTSSPNSVLVEDFDGNGTSDVAIGTMTNAGFGIWPGNGNGTFASPIPFPGLRTVSLAVGDFDSDGTPDLASAHPLNDEVGVVLGPGGTLSAWTSPVTNFFATSFAVGDFNEDGRKDLVIGSSTSGATVLLRREKPGTFRNATYAGGLTKSVSVGDFNGDSHLDLLTGTLGLNNLSVLPGNGDGTFGVAIVTAAVSNAFISGDFDADTKLDVASIEGASIVIYLGSGDGSLGLSTTLPLTGGTSTAVIIGGDFNSDGKLDIAVATPGGIRIFLNLGNAQFGLPIDALGESPIGLAAGDFNRDGALDLASCSLAGAYLWLGRGDGTLSPATLWPAGALPGSLVAGDINGDGNLDLVTTNPSNSTASVLLGGGNGQLSLPTVIATSYGGPGMPAIADFDDDGVLDFAISTNPLSVRLNRTARCR